MRDIENIIREIHNAFGNNEYPGDNFLQGSFEGCEPYEEVGPFKGRMDWKEVPADFLDGHAGALSFFSEAGFRFFLPAYLIADLQGQLATADPLFHLTHGFFDSSIQVPTQSGNITRKFGNSVLINPLRYGAMKAYDYAQYRLSVFTREEAAAVVAYLEYKRDSDSLGMDKDRIDAALNSYWIDRAANAPPAEALRQHVAEEQKYYAELKSKAGG